MITPFIDCRRLEIWMLFWLYRSPQIWSVPKFYWLFLLVCLLSVPMESGRPGFESWPKALWLSYLTYTSASFIYGMKRIKLCLSVVVMIMGYDVCKDLSQQASFKWQLLMTNCPLTLKGNGIGREQLFGDKQTRFGPLVLCPKGVI